MDTYEQRVIIYADILGWSDASTRNSEYSRLLTIIKKVMINRDRAFSKEMKEKLKNLSGADQPYVKLHDGIIFSFFSDSLCISAPLHPDSANLIFKNLVYAIHDLLRAGFLIRGAATLGELHHDGNIIFGPALVEAVKLEQENQDRSPRIICSDKLYDFLNQDDRKELFMLNHKSGKENILNICCKSIGSRDAWEDLLMIVKRQLIWLLNRSDVNKAIISKWRYMEKCLIFGLHNTPIDEEMDLIPYLKSTLGYLEKQYDLMASSLEPPIADNPNSEFWLWRHKNKSESLFCYLKGVKLISTLNAALVLLQQGYAQEINALSRISTDLIYDILFFIDVNKTPTIELLNNRKKFCDEFFQEDFKNANDLLGSKQQRDTLRRAKILAQAASLTSGSINPSDGQEIHMISHQVRSGFVHGAYSQIMELFNGQLSRFHMSGMLGTSRIGEVEQDLIQIMAKTIMASSFVAYKLQLEDIMDNFEGILNDFSNKYLSSEESPAAMVKKMKPKRNR